MDFIEPPKDNETLRVYVKNKNFWKILKVNYKVLLMLFYYYLLKIFNMLSTSDDAGFRSFSRKFYLIFRKFMHSERVF